MHRGLGAQASSYWARPSLGFSNPHRCSMGVSCEISPGSPGGREALSPFYSCERLRHETDLPRVAYAGSLGVSWEFNPDLRTHHSATLLERAARKEAPE